MGVSLYVAFVMSISELLKWSDPRLNSFWSKPSEVSSLGFYSIRSPLFIFILEQQSQVFSWVANLNFDLFLV